MTPLVSVIVPTYNGEDFIAAALDSIFAQSHPAIEVIVCDDGSTDATVDIVRSYANVQLLHQRRGGVSASRNRGAARARGEFLAFLDQDDAWEPSMLAVQLAQLNAHPEWDMVYADSWIVDRADEVRGRRAEYLRYASGSVFNELLEANFIPIETLVIRTETFHDAGGFRRQYGLLEDHDLCLRVARTSLIGFTRQTLARYRIHDSNLSHDIEGILREHVDLLCEFLATPASLTRSERAVVMRTLDDRRGELAWHALRRLDAGSADRWMARFRGHSQRRGLWLKVHTLRTLMRLMPVAALRTLVGTLPTRRLYGVVPRTDVTHEMPTFPPSTRDAHRAPRARARPVAHQPAAATPEHASAAG